MRERGTYSLVTNRMSSALNVNVMTLACKPFMSNAKNRFVSADVYVSA